MTAIVAAIFVVLAATAVLGWRYGHIAEEQAAEARRLAAEWRAIELARTGTCKTLLECTTRLKVIHNLREQNSFLLDRARSTDQPHRTIP